MTHKEVIMDAITQFDLNILHSIHEGISCGFLDAVFPKLTLLCYLFIGAAVASPSRSPLRTSAAACQVQTSSPATILIAE